MKERKRCAWVGSHPLYIKYHDEEWGVPVREDKKMFEFLLLETFQAGLSWFTILKKRENFRMAFANFNFEKIAAFDEAKIEELMLNNGIIRNRAKLNAAVNNAQRFMEIRTEFGSFCNYLWGFTNNKVIQHHLSDTDILPARTLLSEKISQDLKKRGFKFVGATTIYAHMQACGMVNDHIVQCFRHAELAN